MRVEQILGMLRNVSGGNGEWKACCPAHADTTPSLSVKETSDGKILIKCWAGCDTKNVLEVLGLEYKDIMGESPLPQPKAKTKPGRKKLGRMVAHYDYQNAAGEIVFRVARYEPKDFRQLSPDPKDPTKWVFGSSSRGVQREIYRLPQVLAAAQAGRVIFFCEGEKDVQALESLGLVATCNPGGAGKWEDHFCQAFRGAHSVVVIADNDPDEAGAKAIDPNAKEWWQGQKHAWMVGEYLQRDGTRVRRMVLPGVGKDADDWVAAGGTREELHALVKAATWPPEWEFGNPDELIRVGSRRKSATAAGPVPSGSIAPPQLADSFEVTFRGQKIELNPKRPLNQIFIQALVIWSTDDDGNPRKIDGPTRRALMQVVALGWFNLRGKFYYHSETPLWETNMYFDNESKMLWVIQSDAFQSELARLAGVNRSSEDYKALLCCLHDEALRGDDSIGVIPSAFFECKNDVIYISNGESSIVRVAAEGITEVPNGTDDVLFCGHDRVLSPWVLGDGPGVDPFEVCDVLRDMSVIGEGGGKLLFKLWLLWLPTVQKYKPPLLLCGYQGSGKTMVAKSVFWLLGIPERVSGVRVDKGEDDFWLSACLPGILCADNVDSHIKWFGDAVSSLTTGVGRLARRMYTQGLEDNRKPQSALIFTSVMGQFAADPAVADRLLTVRMYRQKRPTKTLELEINITEHRDAALTWMVRTLSQALVDKWEPDETQNLNYRHPDFARWAMRCARALGVEDEAMRVLSEAEEEKVRILLENDVFGGFMLRFMVQRSEWDGTCTDLARDLKEHVEEFDAREQDKWTPRRISSSIDKRREAYESYFNMKKRLLNGRTYYTFQSGKVTLNPFNNLNKENEIIELINKEGGKPLNHLREEESLNDQFLEVEGEELPF